MYKHTSVKNYSFRVHFLYSSLKLLKSIMYFFNCYTMFVNILIKKSYFITSNVPTREIWFLRGHQSRSRRISRFSHAAMLNPPPCASVGNKDGEARVSVKRWQCYHHQYVSRSYVLDQIRTIHAATHTHKRQAFTT